ncbi:YtxH domain-containing protein [Evansella clarkii]|uniref:YtxH domain-containing protein n=1 Tax=Evansella clarkii TaxID=79879 RepID=UPI000B44196E|nr:YtxH domain-containing protein [Evansella clarkii]
MGNSTKTRLALATVLGTAAGGAALLLNSNTRETVMNKLQNSKKKAKEEAKDQGEDLLDDMPKTKNAAKATFIGKKFYNTFEKLRGVKEDMKDNLGDAKEKLQEQGENAKENFQQLGENAKEEAQDAKEHVKENIGGSSSDDDEGIKKPSDIPKATQIKGYPDVKGVNHIKSAD